MSSFACPQGHHWNVPASDNGTLLSDPVVCPVCGTPGNIATLAIPTAALPAELATIPPRDGPVDTGTMPTLGSLSKPPQADDTGGVSVPGYEILRELGRGGMGVVYQARHLKLDRVVALKMILAGGHAGGTELARFRTEAEAIARLQHPNIVQVYEIGEHDGRPFFSLEFCPGGSLDKKLNGLPLPPEEAAQLVETLARAMHSAHQAQVIHRDLKPANVLLTGDGTPKITDFGLARKLDDIGQTQSGAIMGTPSYMAPEQADRKTRELGPACDIYALGAILYELLTGRPPFKAATLMDTLFQVLSDEPVPPGRLQSKTPRDLETICLKCLHKDPARRYPSAKALAEDLACFRRGEPIAARPVGGLERGVKWVRRNPAVAALAAAVLLVLTAGVVVSGWFAIKAGEEAKEASRQAQAARTAEKKAAERAEAEAAANGAAQREKERADIEKRRAEEQLGRAERLVYAGKLALAQNAFVEGHWALALQYLDECQWTLRGWEHQHLWTRLQLQTDITGAHESCHQCGLQPRRQTHPHWEPGRHGEGVGRREGAATTLPYGAPGPCVQRNVQPRRQTDSHRGP